MPKSQDKEIQARCAFVGPPGSMLEDCALESPFDTEHGFDLGCFGKMIVTPS